MRARVFAVLGSLGILLFFTYLAVASVAFNASFYHEAYVRNGVVESAGISEESLALVTDDLIAYMRGSLDELDRVIEVDGALRPAFGARERLHMADVRRLFEVGRNAALVGLLLGLVCIGLAWRRDGGHAVGTGLLSALLACFVFFGTMAIWAVLEFEGLFTLFHLLSFNNDLWLLDPRTELLIRLMPTGFFVDALGRIGLTLGVSAFALLVTGVLLYWKGRRSFR